VLNCAWKIDTTNNQRGLLAAKKKKKKMKEEPVKQTNCPKSWSKEQLLNKPEPSRKTDINEKVYKIYNHFSSYFKTNKRVMGRA
jgi:hypothetical protein